MSRTITKEEAWKPLDNEVSIPVDFSRTQYKFRRRWFKLRNQTTFSTFLPPQYPADQPYYVLTIGVFEGAQEVWLLQNILKHPASLLFCIDPWAATTKLDQEFMEQCHQNAQWNLSEWKSKVVLTRGYSQEVMHDAIECGYHCGVPMGEFDLVIVDGAHEADPVYEDAVNALSYVKSGGWILFDDVRNQIYKPDHVAHGIERWLDVYGDQVELVWAHRFMNCYRKL